MQKQFNNSLDQKLREEILTMITARTNEYDQSDQNLKLSYHFEGYVMALQDLYYRLFNEEIDLDTYDQDTNEWDSTSNVF